ncbi:MAG: EAL domain-containing protein [Gammaproteobacteria bacterium]|nr:EAL domain-containing protein [Gammaproteobacteria bacterium]
MYSLRQRYLFVSTIIVILIFAFAWLAQSYVSHSSRQHHQNVEMRHQASQLISQLRDEILHIEKGLEAFMWGPLTSRREAVHNDIDHALHYFDQLRQHNWLRLNEMEGELADFALDLRALHSTLDRVMDMRVQGTAASMMPADADPTINRATQHFSTSGEELRRLSPALESQLNTTLNLWSQLQQLFQVHLANLADTRHTQAAANLRQEIETHHLQINTLLKELAADPRIGSGSQRQLLLGEMIAALDLWHLSYKESMLERDSNNPRGDIAYLKHTVEPHFNHLWEYIKKLEYSIDSFSQQEAIALGEVANTVALAVWLICFFGLAVISVAYLYFQGKVLRPIATVARILKQDAAGEHTSELPQVDNLETLHLITAYEEMHRQVQDRQQALEHIAMHDSLTSLPNRYHLMERLQSLCETSQREQSMFTVMMLGLDRFKEINDTLGQNTGDTILKRTGQRLRFLLRDSDITARFAGDEFALLLPNTGHDEALYVARKIRNEMERPIDVEGLSLSVSCSIGIALYPQSSQDKEELTRCANIAMAIAKQHKIGIALYEKRFDTSSVERISMAGRLRQAIHANEFHLCYQPQFAVQGGALSGLEVLCRWEDPKHGAISPEEFIPVAEHTGQIHAITEWVVTTALRQAAEWREQGLDCGILAINISVFNLHTPNFYTMLETHLQQYKFPAAKLMLEITETAMMADPEHAIKTLGQLRQLGLKLSIDDYGTGFSSLSYLKQLPVDELKIDKSFVMDMTSNENDAIIVRSTIDLAHNLGLKVVAEGVDTLEKRELLEILGCDYMQGFHLGPPQNAHDLGGLLPALKEKGGKVHHLRDFR